MLKVKKAKEEKEAKQTEHDQAKVNKEVVQVSSNEDDFNDEGDEDLVLFNDVKYPLTDAEIR
ncbi:hypothetical protein Tco_0518559, partial [Tanacetum coccineum]